MSSRFELRLAAVACCLGGLALPLAAHDFWLEPSSYAPAVGDQIAVGLRVGEQFDGRAVGRPKSLVRFEVADSRGVRPLAGSAGRDPAGAFWTRQPGSAVVGYVSEPSYAELGAAAFESYLREEGLDAIIRLRAERGEGGRAGRELFARSAKLILSVGEATSGDPPPVLELPLELLPLSAPSAVAVGDPLRLELRYLGLPLAGAVVVAMSETEPAGAQRVVTDAAGRFSVTVDVAGPWLIKTVHMVPTTSSAEADWFSWWGALTFSIAGS